MQHMVQHRLIVACNCRTCMRLSFDIIIIRIQIFIEYAYNFPDSLYFIPLILPSTIHHIQYIFDLFT